MGDNKRIKDMDKKGLDYDGFRTLTVWALEQIKALFATEQAKLHAQLYPAVGMMYLFHEDNVQAISQYGQEGKTYYFGDTSTEDTSMDRPAKALYYMDNGVQQFVTTEDGEYIVTEPNDQGEMFTAEYHDYITYLG